MTWCWQEQECNGRGGGGGGVDRIVYTVMCKKLLQYRLSHLVHCVPKLSRPGTFE